MKWRMKEMIERKLPYECIPCLANQFVRLANKVTEDQDIQIDIISKGLSHLSEELNKSYAPFITGNIYEYVKQITGINDPYEDEKSEFNNIALNLIDDLNLRRCIQINSDPLDTAIRLSIAGNIIDFSLGRELGKNDVHNSIEQSLKQHLFGTKTSEFREILNTSKKILFLADNAGETAFDKLLLEHLPRDKVTYVVKGGPCVNDATYEDAIAVGIESFVTVIDNGAAYQGTMLDVCSETFRKAFEESDLIISKGQANFETLYNLQDKKILFLLRAKCQVIADIIGCEKDAFVLLDNQNMN